MEIRVSFEVEPPDAREMERRLAATLERLPWLTAADEDGVLGYAYASAHRARAAYRWAVDVSAYVAEPARRRGVGRKLYATLLPMLAAQGFRRAYAGIALPNDPSIALHRASGFERIGVYERVGWKFGAWHDVMWLGRALDAGREDEAPREPVPFREWLAAGSEPDAGLPA
jgi:phosphinothricin acetyltransferase